jgi:hypothetical protein
LTAIKKVFTNFADCPCDELCSLLAGVELVLWLALLLVREVVKKSVRQVFVWLENLKKTIWKISLDIFGTFIHYILACDPKKLYEENRSNFKNNNITK